MQQQLAQQGMAKLLIMQSPINVDKLGPTMKFSLIVFSFLFMTRATTQTQEIGVDICACQPTVYEFTLDFHLSCADLDVGGPGVTETACLTELRGTDNQDAAGVRPVAVGSVQIFELDQNLQVTAQTLLAGNFVSGSRFTYTSIVTTSPNTLTSETLPRGIQLVFTGTNALEQTVINTFIILYTNDCGVYPVLQKGQVAGWTTFSDLGKPAQLFCPFLTADPTFSPTMVPSTRPSQLPAISMMPTRPPSLSPSLSFAPIMLQPLPTVQPSQLPSITPSFSLTSSPTAYQMMHSSKGKGKSKVRSDSQSMKNGKGSSSVSKSNRSNSSSRKG